nr:SAM-dependent methyltransferase [Streptomyces sp. SID3343]
MLAAALRAAENNRRDRLFEDPYAEQLAGEVGFDLLGVLHGRIYPTGTREVVTGPDDAAIRTRFFDDFFRYAARLPSMRQVVLGGAGMDTRAYRLDWPERIRFFEIDRAAVLTYKHERLDGARPRVEHRTVATDLVDASWETDLDAAGYDPESPCTWLLEGLFHYLTESGTHRLLDRVAAVTPRGSLIAADIYNTAALASPYWQPMWDLLKGWGCPVLFGCDDIESLFAEHGFDVRTVAPREEGTTYYDRWDDPLPSPLPLPPQTDLPRLHCLHGIRR